MPLILCILSLLAIEAVAVDPLVKLPYASYRGTPLSSGVTQWMGLPYAAPPLGDLRFAAPGDVDVIDQEYQADSHGPACMGVDSQPGDSNVSEDCLRLDIYSPSDASADAALPVFLYVQGGGFSVSARPPNGTTLVKNSGGRMVVVTFTYRVGPYGFLSGAVPRSNMSPTSAPDFSLNNGLKDQLKALQWVKDHIASFGGDPAHVVLGGASAGGGSVVIHMSNPANSGSFVGAALESPSWPSLPTAEQAQYQLDNVANLTGCYGRWDTIGCLRKLDTETFQTLVRNNIVALPGGTDAPVYMYGPVLDGDIVREYTYSSFYANHAINVPLVVGDTVNEGTTFTPASAGASLAAADAFVHNQFPGMTAENFTFFHAHAHYKPLIDAADYRGYAARLYGDIRYTCPNLFLSWNVPSRAKSNNIWTYLWDVGAATHVAESDSVWTGFSGKDDASLESLETGIHAYWISFITRLEPNAIAAQVAAAENAQLPAPAVWQRGATADQTWAASRLFFSNKDAAAPFAPEMQAIDEQQWAACVELMEMGMQLRQ